MHLSHGHLMKMDIYKVKLIEYIHSIIQSCFSYGCSYEAATDNIIFSAAFDCARVEEVEDPVEPQVATHSSNVAGTVVFTSRCPTMLRRSRPTQNTLTEKALPHCAMVDGEKTSLVA